MRCLSIIVICLCGLSANAAELHHRVVDVQVGGGTHSLRYEPKSANIVGNTDDYGVGTVNKSWGCNLSGVYNWYGKKGAGFQTGARLNLFRTRCVLDSVVQFAAFDAVNGLDYVRTARFNNWTEDQTNVVLSVPVGFAYCKPLGQKLDLCSAVGLEAFIPLSSRYKVKRGKAEVSAYYADYDVTFQNLPSHNFTLVDEQPDGDFNLKVGLSAYLDAGLRCRFYNFDVCGAFYFSYGLLNMSAADGDAPVFNTQNEYQGILNSSLVSNLHPLSFGVRLGVSLPIRKQ